MADDISQFFAPGASVRKLLDKGEDSFYRVQEAGRDLFVKYLVGSNGLKRVEEEFDGLKFFQDNNKAETYLAPTPLDFHATKSGGGVLVTEFVAATRVDQQLNLLGFFPKKRAKVVDRSMAWLANFHTIGFQGHRNLSDGPAMESILDAIKRFRGAGDEPVRAALCERARALGDLPCCFGVVHGDYISANVFMDEAVVYGFDFTRDYCDFQLTDHAEFIVSNLWRIRKFGLLFDRDAFVHALESACANHVSAASTDETKALLCAFLLKRMQVKIEGLQSKAARSNGLALSDSRHVRWLRAAFQQTADILVEASVGRS